MKKYIKEFVTFLLLLIVATNLLSYYRSFNLNNKALDENTIGLLESKGVEFPDNQAVLIHFWATWCPVCGVEASNIESVSKNYKVITIAVKSKQAEIQKYMKEKKLSYTVISDTDGSLASKFKVSVFPTTFIYTKEKKLQFSDVGYTSTVGLYLRMFFAQNF